MRVHADLGMCSRLMLHMLNLVCMHGYTCVCACVCATCHTHGVLLCCVYTRAAHASVFVHVLCLYVCPCAHVCGCAGAVTGWRGGLSQCRYPTSPLRPIPPGVCNTMVVS